MRALKMLLLTLSALLIIAAAGALPVKPCFKDGGNYTFYCGTSSADCKTVTATISPAAEKLRLKNICGESVDFENFDLDGFLSAYGAEVVFTEELDGGVNYYCTANLPYSVNLYGKTINLHVCVRGGNARAASPIIFGGY